MKQKSGEYGDAIHSVHEVNVLVRHFRLNQYATKVICCQKPVRYQKASVKTVKVMF